MIDAQGALLNDESAGMDQTVRLNTCPCAVSTTKPLWTSLENNPVLRVAKAVDYHLMYGAPRRVTLM